ncbi:MAG: hypothetical protein JWM27_4969 [Gemmatimonadetes bacterium]|nr:hypothetical protein [Gemmatimonadota bacterium]
MEMRRHARPPRVRGRTSAPRVVQAEREEDAAGLLRRSLGVPRSVQAADVLRLQRTIGNRAVGRMLIQRTIQDDLNALRADLATTPDPLLKSILKEVLDMASRTTVKHGKSQQTSHALNTGAFPNRQHEVVVDPEVWTDPVKRQSILLHELMHTSADEKYAVNAQANQQNPKDMGGWNLIGGPEQFQFAQMDRLDELGRSLAAIIEEERGRLGDPVTEHMLDRVGRARQADQEFDTVMSELYYYAHKVGVPQNTRTFRQLRALADAARISRTWGVSIFSSYPPPTPSQQFARFSACFITTACCQARGLPDDCEELTVLRAFRDGWMAAREDGPRMIGLYYRIAPRVVAAVQARTDAAAVWDGFYVTVRRCVDLIRAGENEQAMHVYRATVLRLRDDVCPEVGDGDDGEEDGADDPGEEAGWGSTTIAAGDRARTIG